MTTSFRTASLLSAVLFVSAASAACTAWGETTESPADAGTPVAVASPAPVAASGEPVSVAPASAVPVASKRARDDAPQSEPLAAGAPATDAMFACTVDADCRLVDMGVCDICNGGWMLSVNARHIDAARAKYADTKAEGCTERGCRWTPAPFCDAGICSRTSDYDSDERTPRTTVPNFSGFDSGEGKRR